VHPGVYVPRPQTELIAQRAAALLPPSGIAVDACCGCGAIAAVLAVARPDARVRAYDIDPRAVACARENGVDAHAEQGAWPLVRAVDLVVAVAPYVPTDELRLLHRDTLAFESALAYDGGADGLDVVRQVVGEAERLLRPGGALILELGRGQPEALGLDWPYELLHDEDGDVRGLVATK
jgi:release factor glutamine methyltransferase